MDGLIERALSTDLEWEWKYHPLVFKRPAATSRDTLTQKPSWFIRVSDHKGRKGIGEVSIIEGLSVESSIDIESALELLVAKSMQNLDSLPALRFAIEMALSDLGSKNFGEHFGNSFLLGKSSIPINGLIWMGSKEYMLTQIREKLDQGFNCIKLKIGGIDFEQELSLLKFIRKHHDSSEVELRLDANGAFTPQNAPLRLAQLSAYDIHSIEQPIKQGQINEMAQLCISSPIAIALDEELIGIAEQRERRELLGRIQPQYIILKPSLLGGWQNCDEWISIAKEMGTDYWVTSALESNIGLNAVTQWIADKEPSLWQGLGTGGLYVNNIASPLHIENGRIHYRQDQLWDLNSLNEIWPVS